MLRLQKWGMYRKNLKSSKKASLKNTNFPYGTRGVRHFIFSKNLLKNCKGSGQVAGAAV
jgi:uncharacterized membrane protein